MPPPNPNPISEAMPDSFLRDKASFGNGPFGTNTRPEIVSSGALLRLNGRRRRAGERFNVELPSKPTNGVLLALAIAKQQLDVFRRENKNLKATNERLASALADATVRGTEAYRIAHHDELTGLPNRLALMERLRQAISDACGRQHQLALLFIDLDGFKVVNDGHGHTTGDKLLTAAAGRIATCVREDDIACRYGGDEFVVVLSNVSDASVAAGVAETIRVHIGQSYSIDGKEFRVSASIGLAMYPNDGDRSDALLSYADASMYRSKSRRPSMHSFTHDRALQ